MSAREFSNSQTLSFLRWGLLKTVLKAQKSANVKNEFQIFNFSILLSFVFYEQSEIQALITNQKSWLQVCNKLQNPRKKKSKNSI